MSIDINQKVFDLGKIKKPYKKGIFLAATSDSAFALGVMVGNIKEVMPDEIDIFYIAHDGFTLQEQEAFKKVAGYTPIKFISFTKNDLLSRLQTYGGGAWLLQVGFLKRWTHMAYAMFEPLLLLDECSCIVYLDFDILLLKSIKEIFSYKQYHFAAHRGRSKLNPTLKNYNGDFKDARVYRSGIVAYYDCIANPKECYKQIYRDSATFGINDQGVLSLLILQNCFRVKDLGYTYTGSTYWRKSRGFCIIHAWGSNGRFWNNALVYRFFGDIWGKYYQKWLDCGGSPYEKGFICKANYAIERIRFHLAYKLGYAMVENSKSFIGYLKIPFVLMYIAYKHKQEQKQYFKDIVINPHLKVPPLILYEDYKEALKEKQSIPYRLGSAVIKAHKNWYKGGYFNLFLDIRKIKLEYKRKLQSK